ncbi:MAG: hypothetical protein AB8B61_08445 [Cyclobacteriaceae bacterium]
MVRLFFAICLFFSLSITSSQERGDVTKSKLNYCSYENSLLEEENKKLKEFTSMQHKEVMSLKLRIFDLQSEIHRAKIDSIKTSKAPVALLKLAEYLGNQSNNDESAAIYRLLIDIYPNRPEAEKAREDIANMNHWQSKKK